VEIRIVIVMGEALLAMRRYAGAGAGAVALAPALAACQPEIHPLYTLPEPAVVGEHLRFYAEGPAPCEGTLPYMDRYIAELLRIHELPLESSVRYYWFADDPERTAEICSSATACTYEGGTVVTFLLPHEHELVHAVRTNLAGWPSQPFLEEGAAEVWGVHTDYSADAQFYPVRDAIDTAASLRRFPIRYYPTAGSFAAFLVSELGPEAFVRVAGSTEDWDREHLDRRFVEELGVSLESLIDEYEAASWRCNRSVFRDDSLACDIARHTSCADADVDGALSIDFDLSCTSEHVVGPRGATMWSEAAFTLSSSRYVRLLLEADATHEVTVTIRPCSVGCDPEETVITLTPGIESERLLWAGRYLVRVEVPSDTAEGGRATLALASTCVR
jgi:hypothetical protein